MLRRALTGARGAPRQGAAVDGTPAPSRRKRLAGLSLPFLAMLAIGIAIPASAAAAGTDLISGTVTAATGGASVAATVTLYQNYDFSTPIESTTADAATGEYAFTDLNDGDYEVEFSDSGYVTQYYNGESEPYDSDQVCVSASAGPCGSAAQPTQTDIDASLASPAGAVTGTVTAASGGADLAGVEVTLLDADGEDVGSPATTGSNGQYSIPVASAGTYFVEFDDSSAGYVVQYYNGESTPAASDPITVATGGSPVANAALTMGGSITGTVTNSSGTGLSGIEVCPYDDQYDDYGCTTTGSAGTYTLSGLPTGEYKVEFYGSGSYLYTWYSGQLSFGAATAVNVTAPSTTSGINATLQASSSAGSISGTVSYGGQPVSDADIELIDSSGNYVSGTETSASGTYTLNGLPPGTYKVEFGTDTNLAFQFYTGASTVATATAVTVAAGQNVTGINAALAAGGKIAGTVTDASTKAPVADVRVELLDSTGYELDSTYTNAAGVYTLAGVPTGSYVVEFVTYYDFAAGDVNYADQYYNNGDTLAQATKVSVTAGATTSSINAALTTAAAQTPATVTQTVTGAAPAPVTNTVTVVETPPTITGKVSVSKKGAASLSFTLKAGSNMPDISSFTVKLPKGISFNKKKLSKALKISGAKYSDKISKGNLVVTLKSGVTSVKVSVGSKGLTVSKALKKKAKSTTTGTLTVHVSSTNVDKKTTNLSYS
jgi:hypothetical protein